MNMPFSGFLEALHSIIQYTGQFMQLVQLHLHPRLKPCWKFIFTVLYQYQQNSIIYLDGIRLGCSAAEQKA